MRDVDRGMYQTSVKNPIVQRADGSFMRMTNAKLLRASYANKGKVRADAARWCGYADPLKQAMADAGLIPQSPVIGETVDTRGIVNTKVAPPRDEKLYRGKDNGKPRGEVVVQCTKPQHPAPIVVGSYWPRGRRENGELVVRPILRIG